MNSALIPLMSILSKESISEYVTWFSRENGLNPEGFSLEPRKTMKRKQQTNFISGKYVEGRNFCLILGVKCILSEVKEHFEIQGN